MSKICKHPSYSPMRFSLSISLDTASPAAITDAGLADMLLPTVRLLLAVFKLHQTY